jgi:hypothetical protein
MSPQSSPAFDRELVRGWITDALEIGFGLSDTTPDTLVTRAQQLGLTPEQLRQWIYDLPPKTDWTPGALEEWWRQQLRRQSNEVPSHSA